MNLQQLEYFVAVAEEGGFTRAAERVHISQSGLSAQIRRLERELGAPLIDRTTRSMRLTPAGIAALEPARAALAAASAVRRSVDDIAGVLRGRLAVAMVTACTVAPFFDALASFHRAHPGVTIALSEADSDRMIEQVRSGVTDLALVGCAGHPPADLEAFAIVSEGIVAIVPCDHQLAGLHEIALAELVAHPLVCLPPGTGIRAVLDRASAVNGLQTSIAVQASAPDAVLDLALRGLGVAVLSASMAPQRHDLVAVTLTGVADAATLALVWRGSTVNPALRELLRHCEMAFGIVTAAQATNDDGVIAVDA